MLRWLDYLCSIVFNEHFKFNFSMIVGSSCYLTEKLISLRAISASAIWRLGVLIEGVAVDRTTKVGFNKCPIIFGVENFLFMDSNYTM